MKYSAVYLDRYFDSLSDYSSKVELLTLMNTGNAAKEGQDWIVGVSELMNWQAMSERSGVWTYYENLDPAISETAARWLNERRPGNDGFALYAQGIGQWKNEQLMERIDKWIAASGAAIDRLVEDTLRNHKKWFYEDLDV